MTVRFVDEAGQYSGGGARRSFCVVLAASLPSHLPFKDARLASPVQVVANITTVFNRAIRRGVKWLLQSP